MLEKELRNGEMPPSLQHDAGNRIYDGIKYEVWRKEDYEVIVYMDNREIRSRADRDHFQTRLQTLGVKCEVKLHYLQEMYYGLVEIQVRALRLY